MKALSTILITALAIFMGPTPVLADSPDFCKICLTVESPYYAQACANGSIRKCPLNCTRDLVKTKSKVCCVCILSESCTC